MQLRSSLRFIRRIDVITICADRRFRLESSLSASLVSKEQKGTVLGD